MIITYNIKTLKNNNGFWDLPESFLKDNKIFDNLPIDIQKLIRAILIMKLEKYLTLKFINFHTDRFNFISGDYLNIVFYDDYFLDDYKLYKFIDNKEKLIFKRTLKLKKINGEI